MGKLEARSFRAHFIGYPKETMGYYYLLEDHNVIVSRHTVFLKKEFIQDGGSGRKIKLEEKISEEYQVQKPEPSNEPVDVIPPPPCRSSRISHHLERYLGFLIEDLEEAFLMRDRDIKNDLETYDEAMLDIDFEKWMEAIKSKIDSMHSNQVWSLVDPLEGIVPIGCK